MLEQIIKFLSGNPGIITFLFTSVLVACGQLLALEIQRQKQLRYKTARRIPTRHKSDKPKPSQVATSRSPTPTPSAPIDPIAPQSPAKLASYLPVKNFPHRLHGRLVHLVGEGATIRLIENYRQKFPDHSEKWLYEKALYDLGRDRH
jgi:hypothetical protein